MRTREVRSSSAAEVQPVRLGLLGRWWLDRSMRVKGMVVVAVPLITLVGVTSASLTLLHAAGTGRDGFEMAAEVKPTLVLLDNRLPDASGEQVLRLLVASPATAAIPVVILSGDSGRVTVNELLAAGAAEFLAKPFDIQQFLAIIARYLP